MASGSPHHSWCFFAVHGHPHVLSSTPLFSHSFRDMFFGKFPWLVGRSVPTYCPSRPSPTHTKTQQNMENKWMNNDVPYSLPSFFAVRSSGVLLSARLTLSCGRHRGDHKKLPAWRGSNRSRYPEDIILTWLCRF